MMRRSTQPDQQRAAAEVLRNSGHPPPDRYRNIGSASVVRLDGKPRQPAPSTADRATPGFIEAPLPALGQPGPKDVASNSAATRLVLDCLGRAGTPLAKRDILDDCKLPAEAWSATIAILLQQGAVCQEGTKRGARYHLSSSTADAASNSALERAVAGGIIGYSDVERP